MRQGQWAMNPVSSRQVLHTGKASKSHALLQTSGVRVRGYGYGRRTDFLILSTYICTWGHFREPIVGAKEDIGTRPILNRPGYSKR